MSRNALFAAAILALSLPPSWSAAQEATTLRIGDYMASGHYVTEAGLRPWTQEVTAATGGKLTFQLFPSQQLGKSGDLLRLTQANVAQMSNITVAFAGDKLELSGVAELPGTSQTSCEATNRYWQLAKSGPVANEFTANGVHLLYPLVFRPLQLFFRSHPIQSLSSVNGQKLMVPMRTTELMFSKAGAVTQRLPSGPDAYQALQRGTIDGVVFNPDSIYIYDMQTLVKNASQNGPFGQLLDLYLMNLATWNRLDATTKAAIDQASERAAMRACKAIDDGYDAVFERMRHDGITVATFTADEQREFATAANNAATQWASDLDARGKPGSQVLAALRGSR